MTRPFTTAMQNVLRDMVVKPCWLLKLEFVGTDVYLTSRALDVSWSGQTWLGNGWLQGLNGIDETKDHTSTGLTVVLGGYDSTLMSLVLSSTSQNKGCELYFGMLDSSNALIADPYCLSRGKFDTAEIEEAAQDAIISLKYENDLLKIRRTNVFRFTHQSQQALFPGDMGFQYVSQAADWQGFWGAVTVPKAMQKKKRNDTK